MPIFNFPGCSNHINFLNLIDFNTRNLNARLKYFEKLGIAPTTDLKAIKKAYRRKAFALHPDKNPSPQAQLEFIELTDAYEILIGSESETDEKFLTPKNTEEQRAAKLKKARANYKRMQEMEREKDEIYYAKITTGRQWKVFKWLAIYACIFSALLTGDYFLTGHYQAVEQMTPYNLIPNMIEKNGELFEVPSDLESRNQKEAVRLNYSFFFHDLKSISIVKGVQDLNSRLPQNVVNEFQLFENYPSTEYISYSSVYYVFPVLHIFLLLPLYLVRFKRPTLNFAIGRLLSIWVIFPIVILLTFSNGRIFHLFGLI